MDPLTLMLLSQLVPAGIQTVSGLVQKHKADELAKNLQNPVYNIPTEATQALGSARTLASSRQMPGQANLQTGLDQQIAKSTSKVLGASTSAQDTLSALTDINANAMDAQNNIGFQAANSYADRQARKENALWNYAGFRDKAFEKNVENPFLRDAAAASALYSGGMNNAYQGLKGASNAAGMYFGNKQSQANYDNWLKTQTGTPNSPPPVSTSTGAYGQTGFMPSQTNYGTSGQALTPEQIQNLIAMFQSGGNTMFAQ